MGVVPADGPSAQTGIIWSPHQQTQTNPQPPTTVRVMSNSSNYATPVTPAQAYARSVVSGQPVLQHTIERRQLDSQSSQQPGPNLQSSIDVSASTRGQSYAQRLYASSLSKQTQAQTQQRLTSRRPSSGPGESSSNRVPAGPRAPHGARASLMLNADHTNTPQTVSALDFYHSSIAKLDLQPPVPDRGTNSPGARRPQSTTGPASSISLAHSSVPIQAPSERSSILTEHSDGPPPSPAIDPRRSSQTGLGCRSPPSATHVVPSGSTFPPRSENVHNVIVSPVPPPREFSPYSEDYSGGSAYGAAITSNPESVTQPSDPLPQTDSLDVGGSEEVPLYSLIDDEPPPPDFDQSQSMCSVTGASTYHVESPTVLAPPDVPSPTLHESNIVSRAVPSTDADIPSFIETTRVLSPEPLSGSPRAMPEVASYPIRKSPEDVKEKSYGYSTEDSMPEFSQKSSSYPPIEASSSSRTLSEDVPSYSQPRYNTTSLDIPCFPISPAASSRNDTSANTFPTVRPPALPQRSPVVSTPAPIIAPPPPTMSAPPPLSAKVPTVNPVEVPPVVSMPLRLSSSCQPSSPPLPPRARAELTFPPSPPFIDHSAGTTSQIYYTASPSPLPSPPLSQRSQGPSVLSASSTGSHPQLSPDISPTLQGQVPYQSSHQSFQPPEEFRPQLSPTVSHTLQGYTQVPCQSPYQSFQSQASPPPPPQLGTAPTLPAQPVQSSRGLGKNVVMGLAGGALGLLGGAVLAETLSGSDIVDDITGNMDGMTFGNPAGGLFDSNMGTGDIVGSGFDPTANFQGNQTFSGDSFGQTYDMFDQNTGNGVDPTQFQGQSPMQTFDVSQSQQQPNDQSSQGSHTHYLHDAGRLLQAAYKMYNTSHQTDAAQGSQGSHTTAPLQQTLMSTMSGTPSTGCPPNSPPIGYVQTGYPGQTQQTGQITHPMASQTGAQPAATPFSQHHSSVNPASQQGIHSLSHYHHHTSPQSSHTFHTQNLHMDHVAHPSFETATHTMYSQGPPTPVQYTANHGHGTIPHHNYLVQSHAGHSVHPAQHHAQNSLQNPTGQQPPSAGVNKTALAKQFVKGALMAGGVLAKYNRLSGGNGFVGNVNGNNGGLF
ncbi:hypothetical protein BDR04DRAFT_1100681 [Suillus decipiens]|nr:hypothetical protein BDR04DRAFT_1100681 [Suillus decipiens]